MVSVGDPSRRPSMPRKAWEAAKMLQITVCAVWDHLNAKAMLFCIVLIRWGVENHTIFVVVGHWNAENHVICMVVGLWMP